MKIEITKKSIFNLLTLIIFGATWFAIGWVLSNRKVEPESHRVSQVQKLIQTEYYDEAPSARQLSDAAIEGMLDLIDDPYTILLVPPYSTRYIDDFAGQSGVIGMFPEKRAGDIVASIVFPGEPADQAGLQVGDVILAVDDVYFDETTSANEAILMIRGPVSEAAHFVVKRDAEIIEFDIQRQPRPIVSMEMLPEGIGYLAQYTFTTNATSTMEAALEDLLLQNPQGIIWDLSHNGGGSMKVAQEILSFFIEKGALFQVELKDGQLHEFTAQGDALAPEIPLVVLVGEHSYSAAETVAAAIMEHDRGMVLGSTTYGKGTIQTTMPLGQDTILQMTIGKWLSPFGDFYDGRGVTPDIVIQDDPNTEADEVIQFAVDHLLVSP